MKIIKNYDKNFGLKIVLMYLCNLILNILYFNKTL